MLGNCFFTYNVIFTFQTHLWKKKRLRHCILFRELSQTFSILWFLCLFIFLYLSFQNYTFKQAITHFLPILLIVIIPVVFWLIWNVKTGRYTNMDVQIECRENLYIFLLQFVLLPIKFIITS